MENKRKEKDHVIDALLEISKTKYIIAQLTNKAFDAGGLGISADQFCDLLQVICSNPLENHHPSVKQVQFSDCIEKEDATVVTCRLKTKVSSVHSHVIAVDPHKVQKIVLHAISCQEMEKYKHWCCRSSK
jgi:hypothetical protein